MPRRTIRITLVALTCLASVVAASSPAAAELPSDAVRTSDAWEWLPAAGTDGAHFYLAWTQNSKTRPRHDDAFVSIDDRKPFRINHSGTTGFTGGADGSTVVFQEVDGNR